MTAVLGLTLACSTLTGRQPTPILKATSTAPATAAPVSYDGEWTGTTSQGLEISFTVIDDAVTEIFIQATLEAAGCTSSLETHGTFTTPHAIEAQSFSAGEGSVNPAYDFRGTFTSADSASGTIRYETTSGCPGTVQVEWSAARQAASPDAAIPRAGAWTGVPAVAFRVDEAGDISAFHIEIEVHLSGTCTVDVEAVEVAPDGSFEFQFGDSTVEDANLITGQFDGSESVAGTYSRALFCVDPDTGQGVMSLSAEDGTWNAEWSEP
jgi:hypothetical protein